MTKDAENEATVLVAALVADLMFASRIRGAADATGVAARVVQSADAVAAAAAGGARLVLVDLDARRADPVALIERLKGDAATAGIPVVAFVSHVNADAIAAARAAGADRVLARSAFVQVLPELLRSAAE